MLADSLAQDSTTFQHAVPTPLEIIEVCQRLVVQAGVAKSHHAARVHDPLPTGTDDRDPRSQLGSPVRTTRFVRLASQRAIGCC